jgi:hypothetical protein
MVEFPGWLSRLTLTTELQDSGVFGVSALFIVAEVLVFTDLALVGLLLHGLGVAALLALIQVSDQPYQRLFQGLLLLPLLRLLHLGLPQLTSNELYLNGLIYLPMMISTAIVLRSQSMGLIEIGMHGDKLFSGVTGLLLGFIFGTVKYVFSIDMLSYTPTNANLLLALVVTGGLISYVEETIFRGLIQRRLTDLFDEWVGIGLVSILFGIMHSVWLDPLSIAFAGVFSLFVGYLYYQTDDLILAIAMNGGVNLTAYLLFPLFFGEFIPR